MAKREPLPKDATALHVTLRQAVRPVVVAHGILSRQQLAAGELAEEAKALCDLTEEMLRGLGRIHLLTAPAPVANSPAKTDLADRLVDAYASAGMSWARVLSSVTRLAELLVEEGDWAPAGLLARLVTETGETTVAEHIDRIVSQARDEEFRGQLAAIQTHLTMTPVEIRKAVTLLSALPEHPERESIIISRRLHLVYSVNFIVKNTGIQAAINIMSDLYNRTNTLSQHKGLEHHADYRLPESRLFPELLATLDLCGV